MASIMTGTLPDNKASQEPLSVESPDVKTLTSIVEQFRPDLEHYKQFYKDIHRDPEISGMEAGTAKTVAHELTELGFEVHKNIGGHGVVGVYANGEGMSVMIRAELDALPIKEKTDLPYKSTKRMIDRYGNERPIMHACGHDMHMAALLSASALLKAACDIWSGTLIALFQPNEEETRGAQGMIDDGLYDKVPTPDVLLGQHVVPRASGTVAIRPGPVLISADTANIRIIGGPCHHGANPQLCVDPIPLSMHIISTLQKEVVADVAPEDTTIACWGFHAGVPGNDYVAHADIVLDVKAWKPDVRERVLKMISDIIRRECKRAETPEDPVIEFSVRAPLTVNDDTVTTSIQKVFESHFSSKSVDMAMTRACEDFSTLAAVPNKQIPYAYWNFVGGPKAIKDETPTNHSPFFAPEIEPTLKAGTDAMALAALTFLVSPNRSKI